jgi:glycosyltransferase involved in cell wall biosynthesis
MARIKRLLLDVTATHASDLKTGIQRVTLELFNWLTQTHQGEVIPVYLRCVDGCWQHWHAAEFSQRMSGSSSNASSAAVVDLGASDYLLHLDLATTPVFLAHQQGLYAKYQSQGAIVSSLVYDLLPLRLPGCFPPDMEQHHRQWLTALSSFDGALCISQAVANDLQSWFEAQRIDQSRPLIGWFKLGSNLGTFGMSARNAAPRARLKRFGISHAKTFLMVGTIEPRKGYGEALDAFDAAWADHQDCRLIIVGREGWTHLPFDQRRAITEVVYRLEQHPERFRRLVWLGSADDAALDLAYNQADCLLAASLGEGFGLPIIEAVSRGVPVLARDIPVFHEVAPPGTKFFKSGELASAIGRWHPVEAQCANHSNPAIAVTWQDSAAMVANWLTKLQSHVASSRPRHETDNRGVCP